MSNFGQMTTRPWLELGLMYFVVLGCGGGDGAGNTGNQKDGGDGGGGSPESKWATYTSEEFRFSVDMPGEPKVNGGRIGFNNDLKLGGLDNGIFNVFCAKQEVAEDKLDISLKFAAAKYPGDYIDQSEEFIEWNGHRAFRVKAQGPGDQSDICVQNIAIHADGITYMLGVMGKCESMDADVERFRDSFKLVD